MNDDFERLVDEWFSDSLAEEDASSLMAGVKEHPELMRQFVEANVRDQLLRKVVRIDAIAAQILALPEFSDSGSSPGRLPETASTHRWPLTIATVTSIAAAIWIVSVMFTPDDDTPSSRRGDPSVSVVETPVHSGPKSTIMGQSAGRHLAASKDTSVKGIDSGEKQSFLDVKNERTTSLKRGTDQMSDRRKIQLASMGAGDFDQPEFQSSCDGIGSFPCGTIDRIKFGNERHRSHRFDDEAFHVGIRADALTRVWDVRTGKCFIVIGGSELYVNFISPSLQ